MEDALVMPSFKRKINYVTCGFILNVNNKVLFCKPTGSKMLDLPKGVREPGETNLQAAIRELDEETGIALGTDALGLIDLGEGSYNKHKNLHLFMVNLESIDMEKIWCKSVCTTHWGEIQPEVSGYLLLTWDEAWDRLPLKMKDYLLERKQHINNLQS